MAKLVSLSEKAYNTLLGMKKGNESFSDVVLRTTDKKKKKSILRFAGIWKNDREIEKIFNKILKERHKTIYREKDSSG